jgi:hypothetical protein
MVEINFNIFVKVRSLPVIKNIEGKIHGTSGISEISNFYFGKNTFGIFEHGRV